MDDIARMLGMSKKTIYAYVCNKSQLVEEALMAFVNEEESVVSEITSTSTNAIEEISAIAEYVMKSLRKMKPTLLYDLQKYYGKTFRMVQQKHFTHIETTIKNNIARGIEEGFYREDLDAAIQAKIYVGLAQILVDEDRFPSSKYERAYLYKQLMKYHLNGIMNDNGRTELQKYFNKEHLA